MSQRRSTVAVGPVVAVLVGMSLCACIIDAPSGDITPERAKKSLRAAPPVTVKNGAVLGQKVRWVSTRLEPGQATPGELVRVSLELEVLEPITEDYLVFVHIEDPQRPAERLNADHRPLDGERPTSTWKAGETLRDEFQIPIPSTAQGRSLNIWAGFWEPVGDTRLPVSNPDAIRHDGNNRVLLATLPVGR